VNIFADLIRECREAEAYEIADYLASRPEPPPRAAQATPVQVAPLYPAVPISGLPVFLVATLA
jgi:hypothetical protein